MFNIIIIKQVDNRKERRSPILIVKNPKIDNIFIKSLYDHVATKNIVEQKNTFIILHYKYKLCCNKDNTYTICS